MLLKSNCEVLRWINIGRESKSMKFWTTKCGGGIGRELHEEL